MSVIEANSGTRLTNFAIYAYRTLVLSFLVMAVLRFSMREGGWINEFMVFLILSSAFVIETAYRRLRWKKSGSDKS